ncbi:MAG: DRTGG domain-containing protein [Sporomusaceae bacterium]|nr:DRTGG domain-containing protein [Sporomusaceae bacterium]
MIVREMCEQLSLDCLTVAEDGLFLQEITGGIVSDLLSNVMGQAKAGAVWITMQSHQNIVAVASLADLAAVIVAGGATVEQGTRQKAEQEKVLLFTTALTAYEVAGRLYQLGIKSNA